MPFSSGYRPIDYNAGLANALGSAAEDEQMARQRYQTLINSRIQGQAASKELEMADFKMSQEKRREEAYKAAAQKDFEGKMRADTLAKELAARGLPYLDPLKTGADIENQNAAREQTNLNYLRMVKSDEQQNALGVARINQGYAQLGQQRDQNAIENERMANAQRLQVGQLRAAGMQDASMSSNPAGYAEKWSEATGLAIPAVPSRASSGGAENWIPVENTGDVPRTFYRNAKNELVTVEPDAAGKPVEVPYSISRHGAIVNTTGVNRIGLTKAEKKQDLTTYFSKNVVESALLGFKDPYTNAPMAGVADENVAQKAQFLAQRAAKDFPDMEADDMDNALLDFHLRAVDKDQAKIEFTPEERLFLMKKYPDVYGTKEPGSAKKPPKNDQELIRDIGIREFVKTRQRTKELEADGKAMSSPSSLPADVPGINIPADATTEQIDTLIKALESAKKGRK